MILSNEDLISYAIDGDSALLYVNGQKYILDYSTLMDLVWNLAKVAGDMEKSCAYGVERQSLQ